MSPALTLTERPLERSDFAVVDPLLDDALGAGFVDPNALTTYAEGESTGRRFAVVAHHPHTQAVHGVVLVDMPTSLAAFAQLMPGPQAADRVLALFPTVNPGLTGVGLVRSVAVDPEARRQGVASSLIRRAMGDLWDAGVHRAVAVGWIHGGRCPVEKPLLDAGFVQVDVLEDLWLEDSLERGYACPECGPMGCRCPAAIFTGASRPVRDVAWTARAHLRPWPTRRPTVA